MCNEKAACLTATLHEAKEDFVFGNSSMHTPSPRNSRSKTRGDEKASKTSTAAILAATLADLEMEIKKPKTVFAERKMDVEELRDDIHDLCRGLCAKMKHLFDAE
jgi:hypothetical protein